ncbi:MAG: DUF5719 family protein [Actinomycetota bacterium]
MSERTRDLTLMLVVAGLLLAGLGFDAMTDDAGPAEGKPAGSIFYERAEFCPPPALEEDAGAELSVATASDGVPVGVDPLADEPLELSAGATETREVTGTKPVQVEGFGAPVSATSSQFVDTTINKTGPVEGAGGGNCATDASTSWYFPSGDSAVWTDYRLIVANPFPDEAVVKASFITPEGEEPSAQLAEVPVPSGESEVLSISGSAIPQDALSVRLDAVRGRVIAWKAMWSKPDREPPGYEFSLGATGPATTWYFPAGEVSDDSRQAITLMNPGEEESSVSVTLTSNEAPLQSSKLLEISVPASTSKELVLADRLDKKNSNPGEISAVVTVDNDVPIVAESSLVLDGETATGRMTEVGATRASDSWLVGPPASKPAGEFLAIQNPTTQDVRLDLTVYDGEVGEVGSAPGKLQDVVVPGGLRITVPIGAFTEGSPVFIAVAADGDVVVERFALEQGRSDIASIMGQPDFGRPPAK